MIFLPYAEEIRDLEKVLPKGRAVLTRDHIIEAKIMVKSLGIA